MKLTKSVLFITMFSAATSAQAISVNLLSGTLNDQTVFAHTYVSIGAGPNIVANGVSVNGNILSNQNTTLGASAIVSGNTQSRDLTIGDGSLVSGNVTTSGDTSIGANATVSGDLKSINTTLGAHATVSGNVVTVADSTLGATALVSGSLLSGAAATIGANATVVGTVDHGGILTLSANNTSTGTISSGAATPAATVIADEHLGVSAAQTALAGMTPNFTIATGNLTDAYAANNLANPFTAGVYKVNGLLTTTAHITLTLDAQGVDSDFIFNVDNYLTFGAGSIINVINAAGTNSNVIWNSVGYTNVGAGADIVGTILANTYASIGANASVTGLGTSCGGVYSATSYVSLGANASVGGTGCARSLSYAPPVSAVPIPATVWLLGSGLVGFVGIIRRKRTSLKTSA
jgi:predicted acyltransferase (DUF342 family)